MSFIDYNFFPILFFLGWNILTIKQFTPTISNATDFKMLPLLSVFSLNNSINQKIIQADLKREKKSNILEFVSKFQFLNKNPKLTGKKANYALTNRYEFGNDYDLLKRNHDMLTFLSAENQGFSDSVLNYYIAQRVAKTSFNYNQQTKERPRPIRHRLETDNIKPFAKSTPQATALWFYLSSRHWPVANENSKYYFTNCNLINSNWNINFQSNLFDFSYRPETRKFFSSFVPYHYKIKLSLNQTQNRLQPSVFNYMWAPVLFIESRSPKSKRLIGSSMLETKKAFPILSCVDSRFMSRFALSKTKNGVNENGAPKTPWSKLFINDNRYPPYGRFWTKAWGTYNMSTSLNESENDMVLEGLCSSLKNASFSKTVSFFGFHPIASLKEKSQTQSQKAKAKTDTGLKTRISKSKSFINNKGSVSSLFSTFQAIKMRFSLSLKAMRSNSASYNSTFIDSSSLTIKMNTKRFNRINFIQNRRRWPVGGRAPIRSKIQPLLRIPIQKIYSLNRFQIALCFSKRLQPSLLFKQNSYLRTPLPFMEGEPTDLSQKVYNSIFKYGQDELKPQNRLLERPRLETQDSGLWLFNHNRFAKPVGPHFINKMGVPSQETDSSDNYNFSVFPFSYMKTQFFQHIAYNMKHKVSDGFSDVQSLVNKTNLPIENNDNRVTKLSKTISYQEKQNFFTTNHKSSGLSEFQKIENLTEANLNKIPFITQDKGQTRLIQEKNRKSVLLNDFLKPSQKGAGLWDFFRQLDHHKFYQNSNLTIYGGSWYYENLTFPYSIFTKFPITESLLLQFESIPFITGAPFRNRWNYQNPFRFSKMQMGLESDIGIYSLAHKLSSVGFYNGNSEIDIYPFKYNDSYRYNFQNMNLSNYRLTTFFTRSQPIASLGVKPQTEADHKISQQNTNTNKETRFSNFRGRWPVGFLDVQNPTRSTIYAPVFQPQGLNLLSFIYNSFLNVIPNYKIDFQSHRSEDTSSFLSSLSEATEIALGIRTGNRFSIIKEHPNLLKTSKKIDKTDLSMPNINENPETKTINSGFMNESGIPKKFSQEQSLDRLYSKLPIHGLHANPYPWITENALDRWSKYPIETTRLKDSNFTNKADYDLLVGPRCRHVDIGGPQNKNRERKRFVPVGSRFMPGFNQAKPETELNETGAQKQWSETPETPFISALMVLPKNRFKNSESPLYFKEKPSYLKKPLVFFSSFRHLPYFFMSETLSTRGMVFPKTNSFLFPYFSILKKKKNTVKNNALTYMDLSMPEYSLFGDPDFTNEIGANSKNVLKQGNGLWVANQNKKPMQENVLTAWTGYLQHKSFSLKPLSTFIKKGVGYQTRLFSPKIAKHESLDRVKFNGKTRLTRVGAPVSFMKREPTEKNTWKIFPPLFQPFTFRFIDLNLPRSWSSDYFTSTSVGAHLIPQFNQAKPKTGINETGNSRIIGSNFNNPVFGIQNQSRVLKPVSPPVLETENGFPIRTRFLFGKQTRDAGLPKEKPSQVLLETTKYNMTQKNEFRFPVPFYFSDFFGFSASSNDYQPNLNHQSDTKPTVGRVPVQLLDNSSTQPNIPLQANQWDKTQNNNNAEFYESAFSLADFSTMETYKQIWNDDQKFEKAVAGKINKRRWPVRTTRFNESLKSQNSKIIVYSEKPLLKNRTPHGPPLKNQKESISLPNYLKTITNQNYQNLYPEATASVFWILFNKTLFIYLSLHYLRKFISFLGVRFVTMQLKTPTSRRFKF